MATDRARVGADSPISDGAMGGFGDSLAERELLVRKRMEEIISFQERLSSLQLEGYKRQEQLDRREIDIENQRKELAIRERNLELREEEIRRSMGEEFGGFRGFERSQTPVDSYITISRTPNLSPSGSPRPAPPRRTIVTPFPNNDDLKTENERLKRELDLLREAVATSRPPSPLPRTMNAPVKLREIVEAVPRFDGHNISVTQFARACKRALDSLPASYSAETETSLTRLLISKLNGHAYVVVEDLKITRVEQLIDRLKDAFLPAHGTNYYRGQLATEFKKPKEHVLDYFSRIRSLTQSIIDEESKQVGRLERSVERKIEEEGLDAFVRGLPSDYRTALRFERYTDFSSALICLLRIDKQIQEDAKRTASPTYRNRVASVRPIREVIVCDHCKKQGHKEDNCWLKRKSGRNSPSSSNSSDKSVQRRKGHWKRCEGSGGGRPPFPLSEVASKIPTVKTGTVAIRQIKYEPVNKAPCVTGTSQELTGTVTFMIDTGAEINLIKANVLRESTETDVTETIQLTGISQDRHSTLGTAKVRIFGENVKFHLVEENFPIQSNGILGTEFLQSVSATIDYTSGCLGFREKLPPGVYAGEALVKNENGKAYFKVINTTSKPVSLVIQRLELFDYSLGTLPNSAPSTSDPLSEICDPDQSEYLHYVHTIFASTSANETSKRENEDYDLDGTADGTDDLDVTLPSTADAKITETDNEYSDVESASDSADYDKLFSPYTPTRVDMHSRMISENIFETRDSLHLRRDNLIVFTDLSGTPCDDGAKLLNKTKQLPKSEHLVLARAGVTNIGKYKLIIIPIKEQAENSTKFETLVEAIGALLSVARELGLES
ncbi:hypothetical protein M0804_015098, partial [Polistes exclamans]